MQSSLQKKKGRKPLRTQWKHAIPRSPKELLKGWQWQGEASLIPPHDGVGGEVSATAWQARCWHGHVAQKACPGVGGRHQGKRAQEEEREACLRQSAPNESQDLSNHSSATQTETRHRTGHPTQVPTWMERERANFHHYSSAFLTFRIIAGFKDMQLMGIMREGKHLNHWVQNNHNSGKKETQSEFLFPKVELKHFVIFVLIVLKLRNSPTAQTERSFLNQSPMQARSLEVTREPRGVWQAPMDKHLSPAHLGTG